MILLIDNYDSFTWNLWHLLSELMAGASNRQEIRTIRNDAASITEIIAMGPSAIVMSPGPSIPQKAGVCVPLITQLAETKTAIPVLGVCLGHQALAVAFGGRIERIDPPVHGKISYIDHTGEGVFASCPPRFVATRYHSIAVARPSLPECLNITATTPSGMIMGLQHAHLPFHGVQFHPDSAACEYRYQLLANFLTLAHITHGDRAHIQALQNRMPPLSAAEVIHD
ncbi:MAG: aminodeoxychorismate/anthranilate synthase component II [Proteobacteria bacterium]|nr:aminodeoxychorismate/anthranilate synthase component II [Pseudomonadota bacterium]